MKKYVKWIAIAATSSFFMLTSLYKTANAKAMTPDERQIQEEEYYDSLELLGLCAVAEAGGEDELGIRLVIDTVLNRVDSPTFPNDITNVITARNAFTCVSNGSINKVELNEEVCRIVMEEIEHRTDLRPVYFNSGAYPKYGQPLYKVGRHYFCQE